jgi:uncharacterized protein YcbX
MARIAAIYRYPVKGLSAQPLASVTVAPGKTIPFDRAYAIENGPSKFDPAGPRHLPKISFLMLMRNERLAALRSTFDETDCRLTISENGRLTCEGNLGTAAGRRAVESFFDRRFTAELRGPARLLSADGHSFSDTSAKVLSLVSLASLRDFEQRLGRAVNPLRFRANLYVDDLPAWSEFDWVGKRIAAGETVLEAVGSIDRCAATDVDPATAERNLAVPQSLMQAYGHGDCGIYLNVEKGGRIEIGNALRLV